MADKILTDNWHTNTPPPSPHPYPRLMTSNLQVRAVLAIIGPRDIILKVLSSLTPFSMSSEKKPRAATAYKASSWHIPLGVVLGQEWVHFSSRRFARNTLTESWTHSAWFPRPRCRTQSSSPTTLLYRCISWSRILTKRTVLTTRLCMTSALGPSNWPHPHMEIWTIWFLLLWVELLLVCDSLVR